MCALFSLITQGWRFDPMASDGKGLSRRSQLLLWLLQHQPEIIEIQLEYESSEDNDDELLDLSEDEELAEALLKDLLWTENDDEKQAQIDFLETCISKSPAEHETDEESADGDRTA
jgi:hypothetical protein